MLVCSGSFSYFLIKHTYILEHARVIFSNKLVLNMYFECLMSLPLELGLLSINGIWYGIELSNCGLLPLIRMNQMGGDATRPVFGVSNHVI